MARFSSASPSFGFAACLALVGSLASVCRAEVLEVRSGDAVLGLDRATGAPVRLADAGAKLELTGRDQEWFRLVVVPPVGGPVWGHAGRPVRLPGLPPRPSSGERVEQVTSQASGGRATAWRPDRREGSRSESPPLLVP